MKKNIILVLILSLFILIISGCSVLPINPSPTPWPTNYLSTAIALTLDAIYPTSQATFSIEIQIPSPDITEETPVAETEVNNIQQSDTSILSTQRTPSATIKPTLPEAAIQIVSPGSLSKVVSPIMIEAYAKPGAENKVFVELIGEDGQIIASKILKYENLSRLWAPVNLEISFNIDQAFEFARLQIRTEDQFHRTIATTSVHLILQSYGINKIYPNSIFFDRCIIHTPKVNAMYNGNVLTIDGELFPFNPQPIVIELITETGYVINSQIIQLNSLSIDRFIPFKVEIPYQVANKTPVRLTISQKDERIPGNVYVCSQLLVIGP